MAKFVKGDVVVIPFPFSDLSQSKRRPALVLTVLQGNDLILCQITSKSVKDNYAIPVDQNDFASGRLNQESNIRPTDFSPLIRSADADCRDYKPCPSMGRLKRVV